jgi:transcription-repair coupling factor (superfamily II helicase)
MPVESIIQEITASLSDMLAWLQEERSRPVQGDTVSASLGLRRAARLPVAASIHSSLDAPLLLVTDRADHALTLFDELSLWAPDTPRLFVPEPNPLFYEKAPWGEATRRERLAALTSLAAYHIPGAQPPQTAPILVASARAIMTRTLPRREFLKASRSLRINQTLQTAELSRLLVQLGYEPVNTVIIPGQFARRGGIVDVWPPADTQPTRLEFFGDEIDTLRRFDPTTQRTVGAAPRLLVTPAREFLLNDSISAPEGDEIFEFHLPLLHPTPASLLDYLPRTALVAIDNLQSLQDAITEFEEQSVELRRDAAEEGAIPCDFPLPYLTWTEIADSLPQHHAIELGPSSPLPREDEDVRYSQVAPRFSAGQRYAGRLKPFIEFLSERIKLGEKVVIVSRQSTRLQELWSEQRVTESPESGSIDFVPGSLSEGWVYTAPGLAPLHLFTDGEIFGWRRPEPRQRHRAAAETPEASYSDLQAGDYVVHVDHGIGVFVGLVHRTIDSIEREYLCIEYADEAQLFVPVHQADRITRYIGADGRSPTLSRLGSPEWRTAKAHVKEAVQEVAEDLLQLYAHRSVIAGYRFKSDSTWQQELEASFPYLETQDQIRVLQEVKRDMELPRPMDRLICGDVGYGKTEVALRAAFKAVMDGKQVAMLVPTTVLAQQHYQTFRQRLAAFPVEVEMLSRFRTPQQQKEILERLEAGAVDIVIGTHRLLSSDVRLKDLGLLIIDEEQRFGVTHKEALKKMRTEVDVLTLTATPIPRTLYMTLTGVRDISTINTPPEERLPIITHVGAYSPKLVRQAILRELERGGQVFFVHNRVQTINAMRFHLEQLIPEARLTVAHGQMNEFELSEHMRRFASGEVDVLLSTSIIESGLDIPNANTLIVDRADTFGLAQLYQLRGRVGRGAQRAYAYFFRHARRQPSPDGRQRLDTIAENTQLGAGFSIAMRDLEIRGAGDLLGTRQHGQIAAVGFHLYTQLLAEAVRRLRSKGDLVLSPLAPALPSRMAEVTGREMSLPVNVDLPLPASIPADYVADKGMRLHLYRRMADIRTPEELDALFEEFTDRFGDPPEAVANLFFQMKVKLLAEAGGLAAVGSENGQLVLRYPDAEIPGSLPPLPDPVRTGKTALWIAYRGLADWRGFLIELLTRLKAGKAQQLQDAAEKG